jgi:type I restriction enzyme S subunit
MSDELTLPHGWLRTTLGDVLHIVRGVTYDKIESAKEPGEGRIPILRATNIGERLDFDDLVYVPSKCVSEEQMLRRGDIVIAASSGSISVVGKAARLTGDWHGSFGAFCMGLRVNPAIESAYVGYFLGTSEYRRGVSQLAAGSNINNLRRTHIESFSFPLAPMPEQCRIVAKIEELFSDLDAGVAALKRVRANLKRYRAAVLKAAVEGRLTEDWRARNPATEPASTLLERILAERRAKWDQDQLRKFKEAGKTPPKGWKDRYSEPEDVDRSRLPEPPSTWCWLSIDAVAFVTKLAGFEYTKFVRYDPSGDLPVIKAENAGRFGFKRTDFSRVHSDTVQSLSRSRLFGGEVLMVFVGVGVGQVARVPDNEQYFLGPNISMIRIESPGLDPRFVELFLRSPTGHTLCMGFAKAVAQPSLSMGTIRMIPLVVPPSAEQAEIVAEVDRRLSVADAAEKEVEHGLQRAARLRQAILKRAFEGRLVEQDPTDEPAAALLGRVRHSTPPDGSTRASPKQKVAL